MAHVTLPDGRELDVADGDRALLDYYRGQGASVVLGTESATSFSQVGDAVGDLGAAAAGAADASDELTAAMGGLTEAADDSDTPKGKSRS